MADSTRHEFGELLEAHRAIVFKVANTYCRHPEDRADLAQEIAAQLWKAWPGYDAARRFTTWMYRIALNVAISFVRNDRRHRRHVVPLDESFHDVADANALDHEVDQKLRLLQAYIERQSPIDRALLLLYLDERSHLEIGEILGLSETNVSTKIGRLKQRIRNEI
ncbi:MAG: sigma-70 family RNA polymerase sigma factor [Rudaea sp.]